MNPQGKKGVLAGLLAAASAASITAAYAQESAGQGADDTIIVTAQRREQSIQDVPISITAMGSAEIERFGFSEFDDYAVRIPNLAFSASNSSSTDGALSIAIRGIFGSNTTGFYIDDSPLVQALNPRVIDLERIEVLRGPQGTLYGARSMGGTVRLITVQPDLNEYSGRAHAGVSFTKDGGTNYLVDGAVNVPVAPDLFALRAVAYYQHDDGFIDIAPRADAPVPFDVKKDVDKEKVAGFQVAGLLSLLGGDLTITPRFMYEKVERDGRTLADFTASNRVNLREYDIDEPNENEWWLATLTAKYDAGFGTFISASSWFDRSYSDTEDFSEWTEAVLAFQGASIAHADTDQDIFSQELRFVSGWDAPIDLTIGGFYQKSKSNWVFPATPIDGFAPDVFNLNNPTTVTEKAIFAEATWNATEDFRVILGGRVFKNEVDFYLRQGGAFIGPDEVYQGVQSETGFTPKVGLQYDLDDDRMLYATMSEGFRIGGVNFYSGLLCAAEIASLGITDASTFDSDSLRSYEAGLKSRWLGGKLTANAAGFYVNWKDLQQRQGLACGFSLNVNAGEAELKGGELELDFAVTDNTRLLFGLGYVDSEITDNGGVSTVTVGQEIQNVPNLTFNAAIDHDFTLGALPAFIHLDYSNTGESYSGNNSPTSPLLRPAFDIANARIGVEFPVGTVTIFADNLFDEKANYADIPPLGVQTPGRPRIAVNQPRTVGLEWRVKF
ncbi:MAG: TonB-dependent receptor [Caulobacterales bacterium]|nr:TonB-dependent receptor [Caulobacterales bacterium]